MRTGRVRMEGRNGDSIIVGKGRTVVKMEGRKRQ